MQDSKYIILLFLTVIFISGCINKETKVSMPIQSNGSEETNLETTKIIQNQSILNINNGSNQSNSSSSQIVNATISDQQLSNQTQSQNQKNFSNIPPSEEEEPKIEHIGIELEIYDPLTERAGDFVFINSKVFHNKIFQDYGELITETPDGKPKHNPQPTYLVPLGTKVRALTNGTVDKVKVLYSGDYTIMIMKSPNSPYRYELEHVINPLVKDGDRVVAGQIIAEASPHNSQSNSGYGLFEIGILK